jgi:hypothetical protein
MIEDCVSGYLFNTEDEAIAMIRELLNCKNKRCTIGRAAREHSSQTGWSAATLDLVEQYKRACEVQHLSRNSTESAQSLSFRKRTSKVLARTTMFAIRKLLP